VFFRCTAITVVGIFFSGLPSRAEDKQPQESMINAVFGRFGFHTAPNVSPTKCIVKMDLNQKTFLDNFELIKKFGLLNETLDNSQIYKRPNSLSMAFMFQMLPVATKTLYEENSNADKCEFEQTITILDDYGNEKALLALSYTFTRAVHSKINWDNFPNQNIMKVAPKFRFTTIFQSMVSSER